MSCIFCRISSGEAPASFVHKDNNVMAIMSLDQPNRYKVLVVPRKHVESIYDLDDRLAGLVFQCVVKIARTIRDVSNCQGLNLVQSNGSVDGDGVAHFHIHLVPRFAGDKIRFHLGEKTPVSRKMLDQLSENLRTHLSASSRPLY